MTSSVCLISVANYLMQSVKKDVTINKIKSYIRTWKWLHEEIGGNKIWYQNAASICTEYIKLILAVLCTFSNSYIVLKFINWTNLLSAIILHCYKVLILKLISTRKQEIHNYLSFGCRSTYLHSYDVVTVKKAAKWQIIVNFLFYCWYLNMKFAIVRYHGWKHIIQIKLWKQ